jgi:serine protease
VVSAGNDAGKEVKDMMPAGLPEVIAVASTTAKDGTNQCRFLSAPILKDTASYFTTDGAYASSPYGFIGTTISAPGEDSESVSRGCFISSTGILSLKLGGGTTRMSGTSMSSPHVSGIVARFLQKYPASTPGDVRTYLRTNPFNRAGTAPVPSPASSYTSDGEKEGIALAPAP